MRRFRVSGRSTNSSKPREGEDDSSPTSRCTRPGSLRPRRRPRSAGGLPEGRARRLDRGPASPAAAPTAAPLRAAEPQRLVGRWQRSDADYAIEVARADADGSVEAKYFNPGPIHVSRAAWKVDAGRLLLFVELTDRGYPGNNYALVYDPGSDSLAGEYRHLGLNETYEVAFSRLKAPGAP